jgi:outer membrane biosynthesis protein TonB
MRRERGDRTGGALAVSLALHALVVGAMAFVPNTPLERPKVKVYAVDIVSPPPNRAGDPVAAPLADQEPGPAGPAAAEPEPAAPQPEPPAPEPEPAPPREAPKEPAKAPAPTRTPERPKTETPRATPERPKTSNTPGERPKTSS